MKEKKDVFVCPNCGASITNQENCEYCGSLLVRFAVNNIDLTKTRYLDDNYVMPGLIRELEKNLKLQENTEVPVCTDICIFHPVESIWLGKYIQFVTIQGTNCEIELEDGKPYLPEKRVGLCVIISLFTTQTGLLYKAGRNKMLRQENEFRKLDSFSLFDSYYFPPYGTAFAIDFGKDVKGAARLVSEIVQKIFATRDKDIVFTMTNRGENEIASARSAWAKQFGFRM